MDVDSEVVERAIENILHSTKARLPWVWLHHKDLTNEEWESRFPFLPGRGEIVVIEDLAADEQRKQAIEGMLPYLPPDYHYVVRKSGRHESFVSWMPYVTTGLGQSDASVRRGKVPLDLFEDSRIYAVLLPGIEGARAIRCELTDQETGEKAKCFLLAHLGLEELLNSLRKQYYREIFLLKEWWPRQMKRKYLPYVRIYGMLKSLGVSGERLKKIRLELWHQYWKEYQEQYGDAFGEPRDRQRRAFNRELERKSELIVERWRRLSEEQRQRFVEEWAEGIEGIVGVGPII